MLPTMPHYITQRERELPGVGGWFPWCGDIGVEAIIVIESEGRERLWKSILEMWGVTRDVED
jgi:hypothetical protein